MKRGDRERKRGEFDGRWSERGKRSKRKEGEETVNLGETGRERKEAYKGRWKDDDDVWRQNTVEILGEKGERNDDSWR